jgi:hypothetical protein
LSKNASEPAEGLTALITKIVDEVLKKRRMRPTPTQAGMSKQQFATSVGVGVSTVEAEIREGRLEALKVRDRTIITFAERERWLATRPRIKPAKRESVEAESETAA